VKAPTLLIVGGEDHVVIDLERAGAHANEMRVSKIDIVAGATHLFEEAGAPLEGKSPKLAMRFGSSATSLASDCAGEFYPLFGDVSRS